jgi:acetaldehyde dehydrogenase
LLRSDYVEVVLFTGRNLDSPGCRFAAEKGVPVSDKSIEAIIEQADNIDIVFDATTAASHLGHAPILKKFGIFAIDLTPAKVGKMCVPVVNLDECVSFDNVNMVTCGGQGSVPIAYAITRVHPETTYIEMVSTIASKSAGIGTRDNIDEFTQTTKEALSFFSHVAKTKAIITLNPAEPPINMRNTVYALVPEPDIEKIGKSVHAMEREVQKYVSGYHVTVGPVCENGRVTTTVEVMGLGDYLPSYAGNLDIMTNAAVRVAERRAQMAGGVSLVG